MRIHPKLKIRGFRTELENYFKNACNFFPFPCLFFLRKLPCMDVSVYAKPHASACASAAFFSSRFLVFFLAGGGAESDEGGPAAGPCAVRPSPDHIPAKERRGPRRWAARVPPRRASFDEGPGRNDGRCSAPEKDCATRARARAERGCWRIHGSGCAGRVSPDAFENAIITRAALAREIATARACKASPAFVRQRVLGCPAPSYNMSHDTISMEVDIDSVHRRTRCCFWRARSAVSEGRRAPSKRTARRARC